MATCWHSSACIREIVPNVSLQSEAVRQVQRKTHLKKKVKDIHKVSDFTLDYTLCEIVVHLKMIKIYVLHCLLLGLA